MKTEIIMTTEGQGDCDISERLGIVTAQCAFGQKVFDGILASVQDIVDRRTPAVERALQDAVHLVLNDLKSQAMDMHADAVIAISLQYTPIGSGACNRTLVSGIGTAVRLQATSS